jgi:hypothetical protein
LFTKYKLNQHKTPLWGSQTQEFHYLEDKARYKIVTLTYTRCSGRTLLSDV